MRLSHLSSCAPPICPAELYEQGGEEALLAISRKKPIIANRVDPAIEQAGIDMAIECPAYGQLRMANELNKQGIIVSPGGALYLVKT